MMLQKGIENFKDEQKLLMQWQGTPVAKEAIAPWVDNAVRNAWKFKAAAKAITSAAGAAMWR